MLVMAGLALAMVLTRTPSASQTGSPADNELRTARITVSPDGSGCSQQMFDNQTGRIVKSTEPCGSTTAYDSNGVAIPLGTNHRLDAISKSFSGQR